MPATDLNARRAPDATPGSPPGADAVAQQLVDCQTQLQAAQREIEQFAFAISHDLRAPLRAIESFAALLERGADDKAPDHLQRIRAAASRMAALLDAMTELAHAGRHALRIEPVDLSLLAEWAAAELVEKQPERDASIVVQPDLVALGDERLLRLVLGKLLANAWRFTAPGQLVRIEVTGTRDASGLRLSVRDHGIGFEARYADKLFEPFQRLHGPDQGAGSGLGLAIARRAVERHGGRIHGEPAADGGSLFVVELPDTPASSGSTAADGANT